MPDMEPFATVGWENLLCRPNTASISHGLYGYEFLHNDEPLQIYVIYVDIMIFKSKHGDFTDIHADHTVYSDQSKWEIEPRNIFRI